MTIMCVRVKKKTITNMKYLFNHTYNFCLKHCFIQKCGILSNSYYNGGQFRCQISKRDKLSVKYGHQAVGPTTMKSEFNSGQSFSS